MIINRDTTVCISIAVRPGNFGATIFNAAFQKRGLNFIYKPFQLDEDKLEQAIQGIRALGIRGCGVSMPHKINVIPYLDELDPAAEKSGAVNTIVNTGGILKGYNTDYVGTLNAIKETYDVKGKKVLIIGAGGVARAIIVAIQELGAEEIILANRDEERGKHLGEIFEIQSVSLNELPKCDLLINATSVGMAPNDSEMILSKEQLASCEAVMDVVNLPLETALITAAKRLEKVVIPGYQMTLNGAATQFELYTGEAAPLECMKDTILNRQ